MRRWRIITRIAQELDWLVPHQANLRIISATAKKLGMSMDNVVVTLGQARQYLRGFCAVRAG